MRGEWFDGLRQGLPAVDLAHGDLARGEQGPEQHGPGLDAAAEFLVQPLDGALVRADLRCDGSRRVRAKSRAPFRGLRRPTGATVPFTLEAVGDRPARQAPLARGDPLRRVSTSAAVSAWIMSQSDALSPRHRRDGPISIPR